MVDFAEQLGDAEVEQFRAAVGLDHHVRGLEVAVHDQVLVGELDRFQHAEQQGDTLAQGQSPLAHMTVQRQAFDALDRHPRLPGIGAAAIQHARYCRVFQPRQQLAFALETHPLLGRMDIAHHLDRDFLAEAAVVAHAVIDGAHPAAAKQSENAIWADVIWKRRDSVDLRHAQRRRVDALGLRLQPQNRARFGCQRRIVAAVFPLAPNNGRYPPYSRVIVKYCLYKCLQEVEKPVAAGNMCQFMRQNGFYLGRAEAVD